MSTIDSQTFTTVQAITTARVELVKISTPLLCILGNFGEICSIIVFIQHTFRNNSCAIYFLAASCIRLLFINLTILPSGLAIVYNIEPANTSLVYCKIKYYIAFITAILSLSFVVLASIDRFMLSSRSATVRAWSHPRVAYRLVVGITLFWMIITVHTFVGVTVIMGPAGPRCYFQPGPYKLSMALYSIIINYLLPPILMAIFGLLTIANIRQSQRQIRPIPGTRYTQRKDRHLLHMLVFQVLISVIFTIPGGLYQIYGVMAETWRKDIVWLTWELFFFTLAVVLYYIPNCIGFYIYTLTAGIFRQEFKRIAVQCYRRFRPRRQIKAAIVKPADS